MLTKTIEFSAKEYILQNKKIHPVPCKLNIPDWFKKLSHTESNRTIKGCIPVLDSLTAGYILKIPIDLYIEHNTINKEQRITEIITSPSSSTPPSEPIINLNNRDNQQVHPVEQVGDKCPHAQKNKNLPFHKILNPWTIKTPPGYSCLFLPPLNNTDDRFSIIPGIVDTDSYTNEINFPFIVNGDKYPVLKSTIKEGTPYVQVIPFKRDSWKMELKKIDKTKQNLERFKLAFNILNNYKNRWWHKKSWK